MTVAAVVFDIGNVLISWQPEAVFDRLVGPERRAAFFDAVPIMDATDEIDWGADFDEVLDKMKAAHPDWRAELDIWHHRYVELITPAIDHSVRLLRALRRANVPVYALSNFGAKTFDLAEVEYPFLEEFDLRFISGQMKVAKPDPAIYAALEDACGVSPDTLLFADDRTDNLAAAEARGWQTHLFKDPDSFAKRLIAENLLTPEAAK